MTLWRHDESMYQVDVALFQDSDGDGIGDLRGVIRHLPYIRSLGIGTIWLTPFYETPFRDHGYDITDHYKVDPRFGTISDFVALLERAERLGLRVIVELVMQHVSVDHPWFQSARECRDSPYRDYFIWSDEPVDTGARNAFPGVEDDVWTWDEQAGQYYRHMFYSHQPDLDYANPKVREELFRVMQYWLRLGVSGFRVDAATYMVERAKRADPRKDGLWLLEDMHRYARRRVHGAMLMGEADIHVDRYDRFLADGRRMTHLLDFWINNHLFLSMARGDARPLHEALREHGTSPPYTRHCMWLRNHDQLDLDQLTDAEVDDVRAAFAPDPSMWVYGRGIRRRLAPMLDGDPDRIAMAHALLASLPGVPVLRYGEEIGMGDDLSRPERNAVRTPMQWSARANGGFSGAARDQLVAPPIDAGAFGFQDINVAAQHGDPRSVLERVRRIMQVRLSQQAFRGASREAKVDDPAVFALRYDDTHCDECLLVLVNLTGQARTLALREDDLARVDEVLADRRYDPVEGRQVELGPWGYRWLNAGCGTKARFTGC